MIWYLEDRARLHLERRAIESLALASEWLTLSEWRVDESARLNLELTIDAAGRQFVATLRYPNHFPHSPAMVLPTDETRRWSSHQWGAGGELCLEHGPDNWQPAITGAMMLESAFRLLQGEAPDGETRGVVASRHRMSLGQNLRSEILRFLVPARFERALETRASGVYCGKLAMTWRSGRYVYHPIELEDGDHPILFPCPTAIVEDYVVKEFAVVRLQEHDAKPVGGTRTAFMAALAASGCTLPEGTSYCLISRGSELAGYLLATDSDRAFDIGIVPSDEGKRRLPEDLAVLRNRKIAIVGCGSLGSKVAISLARSGVGTFLLIDDDILQLGNLVRHELDYVDLAHHKVDGVARRISLVSDATVQVRRHLLGGQESSGSVESLIESIAECDLIIDCTSDAKAFNYLCAAVSVGRKPFISGEIFAGGVGGRMMRCRPGLDPDPASCRSAVDEFCRERGRVVERGNVNYENRRAGAAPLIATDADVVVMAGHIARFSIDLLVRGEQSLYPVSAYIIGFQEGWLFDLPFETWPIDLGRPAESADTTPLAPSEEEDASTMIRGLFERLAINASSGSQ